jgi:osmotically-inducible protein OsmY
MMIRLPSILAGLLLTLPVLNGCTAVVVGGAAATGVLVAHDRRTSGAIVNDQEIELNAYGLLNEHADIKERSHISVTSYNMRVLLTGETESAELARRFASLVSQLPHVRSVYNEVAEDARAGLWDETEDTYLTSKVKLSLFNVEAEGFDPSFVKVVTSRGTVYLMGLVTTEEGASAIEVVRGISGVRRVVEVFEYTEA